MKSVLITGATGYFGRYMVEDLCQHYHVLAVGRNEAKLNEKFGKLKNVTPVVIDLGNIAQLEKETERLCREYEVFGLINNAYELGPKTGFNTPDGALEKLSSEVMNNALTSGLLAPMLLCQIVGRQLLEKKQTGSLINISSMYGTVAPDVKLYEGKKVFNPLPYGVTKAGLNALTRYVASFWGPQGIRCNSVAPGPFPNTETQSTNNPDDEEFMQRLVNKTTLKRVGHPRDLLGIIRLLLSEEGSYITGQTIAVDGGWTVI